MVAGRVVVVSEAGEHSYPWEGRLEGEADRADGVEYHLPSEIAGIACGGVYEIAAEDDEVGRGYSGLHAGYGSVPLFLGRTGAVGVGRDADVAPRVNMVVREPKKSTSMCLIVAIAIVCLIS